MTASVTPNANTTPPDTDAAGKPAGAPPIADPIGLGLAAFSLTTFVLSLIFIGAVPSQDIPMGLALAVAYGGLTQFVAGMWAFKENNTFGAVGLTSYGAFWISYWLLNQFYLGKIPPADRGGAVGLYLIAWGIFTIYMWAVSFRISVAINSLFAILILVFFVLGIGEAANSQTTIQIGAGIGILLALNGWYVSAAIVANRTVGRQILPLGTRSAH